jgi:hypothetical protein
MSLILNQAQAEAVYSAMCALNNVNAGRSIALAFNVTEDQRISVREFVDTREVHIGLELQAVTFKSEHHADQSAFAAAYGLGAADTDVDVDEMAKDAVSGACLFIQNRLGVKDGDVAAAFFSGENPVTDGLQEYIHAELSMRG